MEIKIEKINNDCKLPTYNNKGEDVGLDLYSREERVLKAKEYKLFKAGVKIAIPRGYAGFVNPRSGLALKKGVTVLNADGVIDPSYRGELGVILINHSNKKVKIKKNDRIAQLIIQKIEEITWREVKNLENNTLRGEKGFGKSGR